MCFEPAGNWGARGGISRGVGSGLCGCRQRLKMIYENSGARVMGPLLCCNTDLELSWY